MLPACCVCAVLRERISALLEKRLDEDATPSPRGPGEGSESSDDDEATNDLLDYMRLDKMNMGTPTRR